jgi:hypothetical protein
MLTIDEKTSQMTADVKYVDSIEAFECALTCCQNPVCTCGTVYLELTRLEDVIHENPVKKKVVISLNEKQLDSENVAQLSEEDLKFSELVLSQLNEHDFRILETNYWILKHELTKEADLESIEAHFDFNEVERDGLMFPYNDILPFGNQFLVNLEGKNCLIFDQYCILPKCPCTDIMMNFYEIGEQADNVGELFAISLDYKKKTWELTKEGSWPVNIEIVRSSILNEFPDFYKQIKTRHAQLKTIYANCKKRNYSTRPKTVIQKVGRNDPCPCGSGKKFKKCCLNKS